MTTTVKNLLTALVAVVFLASAMLAEATSVREYQAMSSDEKVTFLGKETDELLAKVKTYDPQLEQKTRFYMLDETNEIGGSLGLGAVLDVVSVVVLKHPETMDKIQMETITKVIMENFWKRQGIVVPDTVLNLRKKPVSPKPDNSGTGTNAPNPPAQP